MKKGLLLYLPADNTWIGGVYYIKNIAYQISQSYNLVEKYNIFLLTNIETYQIYTDLPKNVRVLKKKRTMNIFDKIVLLIKLKALNIKYIYPHRIKYISWMFKIIDWVPDFQDKYFPDLFVTEELIKREKTVRKKISNTNGLILSSKTCVEDIKKFYTTNISNIYVMPFVSYIENEIGLINQENEKKVLEKFNLFTKKFVCTSNQFWKHKNHLVVLKAIQLYFMENNESNVVFVFTGNLNDRRNPEYLNEIRKYFEDIKYKDRIINLGFINRIEQLIIMKNSEFIIQPSLFEGWGTVLEDCKVLDKTVILSDIPIHREQRNDNCILFDPSNPCQLKSIIEAELDKQHVSNVENGILDMKTRAKLYVREFEKCLGVNE